MPLEEEERAMLDDILENATQGGVVIVPSLQGKFIEKLGRPVALSTIYRMLARHGWRTLALDTEHRQGDAEAREEWGETPRYAGSKAEAAFFAAVLT